MPVSASAVAPLLTVTVAVFAAAVVDGSVGPALVPYAHNKWPERYKRYDGTAAEVKAAMVADGFSLYSDIVAHVYAILDNPAAPTFVLVGRRADSDASWDAALTAILSAIELADETAPKYLLPVTRTESQMIELFSAATANQRDMLPVIQTASAAVKNNDLGSLEKQLKALNKQGVILYYDAATATAAAAATATTTVGPWAVTLDTTTSPPQATASITFDDGSADVATLQAERGTVLGSNNGPFNAEPGWHLDYERDADGQPVSIILAATAATVTGTLLGTFALADAMPVHMTVRGNPVTYLTDTANYVDIAHATAAEVCAEMDTALGALANSAASGGYVQAVDVKRGTSSSIGFTAGTSALFAAAIGVTIGQLEVGTGNVADVDAVTSAELAILGTIETGEQTSLEASAAKVRVSGNIYGTGGSVSILASSTAGFLTALGLSAGVTNGSGDCADSRALQPAELFTLLDADWGDATVVNNAPGEQTVTVSGGDIGAPHIMVIEGALAGAVGLLGTAIAQGSADQHADAAWAGSRIGINHDSLPPYGGCLSWNNVPLRNVFGMRKSFLSTGDRLNRTQDVNYAIRWSAARGAEAHDGRLLIRHEGGASAYADQWEAAQWIAKYSAAMIKAALDQVTSSGNQVPYQDPNVIAFFQGEILKIASRLFAVGIIASIDLDPTGPGKATGLTVLRKAQLASTDRDLRLGKLIWTVELSGALHGGIVQIGLFV